MPTIPVELIRTENKEKAIRAAPLANKMANGEVFVPHNREEWRLGFESEFEHWTGKRRERCDQIDAAAYAAIIAERQTPGVFVMQHIAK